ncbi:MAG: hypothetical protein QM638_01050 [Nocardioides sp.]|uniref:hypothetical protein n=1 Tax=Nocardioides sp. TaxID=35761 RepID=UPI0039E4B822
MGRLLIDELELRADDVWLDAFQERFAEAASDGSGGFWIAGPFKKPEGNHWTVLPGEKADPDGHQVAWVSVTSRVRIWFDRSIDAPGGQEAFPLPA